MGGPVAERLRMLILSALNRPTLQLTQLKMSEIILLSHKSQIPK